MWKFAMVQYKKVIYQELYRLTSDSICAILRRNMDKKILSNPKNVKFHDLLNLCQTYFGNPRISGSHHIFKMPWRGDPRINI